MLQVINESSVTTITGTLPFEVSLAIDILDETIRELLQDSYVFNTEREVVLTPNVSNNISVPSNYVQIWNTGNDYVIRNGLLYSMVDKTSTFTSEVTVDVVYLLDFEDLPEAAKNYCKIRAARVYSDRMVGAKDIRAFTQQDEIEAKAKLMNYVFNVDRPNLLSGNNSINRILRRRI